MNFKDEIKQYYDLVEEIHEKKIDYAKTENAIEKLIDEGTVKDKVTGGEGGIQGFYIEGIPEQEYKRRLKILTAKKMRLEKKNTELLEKKERIEKFIDEIPVSRDRRIFKMYYIEKMTQEQIARKLYIERSSVSKILKKYI